MCKLQQALRICERWAYEFRMKGTLKTRKSRVLLSHDRAPQYTFIPFVRGNIDTATQSKYLGVQVTTTRVREENTSYRRKNAHMTCTQLKIAELVYSGMDAKYECMIFKALLQTGANYVCFLLPRGHKATKADNHLTIMSFSSSIGMRVKKPPVLCTSTACHIWSRLHRIQMTCSGKYLLWKNGWASKGWVAGVSKSSSNVRNKYILRVRILSPSVASKHASWMILEPNAILCALLSHFEMVLTSSCNLLLCPYAARHYESESSPESFFTRPWILQMPVASTFLWMLRSGKLTNNTIPSIYRQRGQFFGTFPLYRSWTWS